MRLEVIDLMFKIAKQENAYDLLEEKYLKLTKEELIKEIIQVGIMPEVFEHDSSEEKLWSKYSDVLLASSLNCLGLNSKVLRTRGNSADVYSEAGPYTLVSDAKCFRLSRTAKNQKDFKIKALDDWRRKDTYALLVSPYYQYPIDKSQIYSQAISKNVTLLSYTHLMVLLENSKECDLTPLWEVGKILFKKFPDTKNQTGKNYWGEIDKTICSICNIDYEILNKYKRIEYEKTIELGREGINYWENKIREFEKLSREDAIRILIKSEKIEQKIETIKKVISKKFIL